MLYTCIYDFLDKYIKYFPFSVFILILVCKDEIPNIQPLHPYCYQSCQQFAYGGYCDTDWSIISHCFSSNVTGPVKDDCEISCNKCGGTNFIDNKINYGIFVIIK